MNGSLRLRLWFDSTTAHIIFVFLHYLVVSQFDCIFAKGLIFAEIDL